MYDAGGPAKYSRLIYNVPLLSLVNPSGRLTCFQMVVFNEEEIQGFELLYRKIYVYGLLAKPSLLSWA